MECKNILVSFLYHKANVSYVCVFGYVVIKRDFIVAVSKLEQPSC